MFQHTAARRRLEILCDIWLYRHGFNTQPPEGGWPLIYLVPKMKAKFQHTAARRRLGVCLKNPTTSTGFQHTAARRRLAACSILIRAVKSCFNTQPPEGGWWRWRGMPVCHPSFNTQPPEGGWWRWRGMPVCHPSFNTQPPEGGWLYYLLNYLFFLVSTHSRPKAAGSDADASVLSSSEFQHTAARRRLALTSATIYISVSGFNTQPPEGGWPELPN